MSSLGSRKITFGTILEKGPWKIYLQLKKNWHQVDNKLYGLHPDVTILTLSIYNKYAEQKNSSSKKDIGFLY